MAELDKILSEYVKPQPGALDGLLGAAFIVKDKNGMSYNC
jgi:hypothetical protein